MSIIKEAAAGALRIFNPVREGLVRQMTDYFGPHYEPDEAKSLTETIEPGGRIAPRYNRRGTEFMALTKGSATVNQLDVVTGDVVRIDAGEIVEITSREGCEFASLVFPYRAALVHVPYVVPSNPAPIERLGHKEVSIVIIAQDIQYHICHAISSCLTQTYPNLQIIVVNDNSEDATGTRIDTMARFDPRIEVHHVDLGMNGSRKYGLEQATGDFCLMIDGDDWLNRDAVEKLLTTAQNLDSELVLFGYDHYNDKTRETWNPVYPSFEPRVDVLLPSPINDHDARQTAKINHTVWMNFFSLKLREAALSAMRNIYQYEDLPFSLSLMQHAKNPGLCNLILHNYRRERTGQSTEKWWKVLPSQKQACLRVSVEHALNQFDGDHADYHRLILLYKIYQIVTHEVELPMEDYEKSAWRSLLLELYALFPDRLYARLVEPAMKPDFRAAHPKKAKR